MTKWWTVNWKRVGIALAAVFAVMWLIGEAMKFLAPWTEARSLYRENPSLASVPVPLPDQNPTPLSGVQVYLYGLTIQTPWSEIGTIESDSNVDYVPFPKERVTMVVFEPGTDTFAKQMWDVSRAAHDHGNVTAISDYGLMAAEMAATPDQVKWWRTPTQNEASVFLLEMKSMTLGKLRGIYTISANGLRGFQQGDPAAPPYQVRVDLFDSADRHYEFIIGTKDERSPALSQAQLNALIASLRPIPKT